MLINFFTYISCTVLFIPDLAMMQALGGGGGGGGGGKSSHVIYHLYFRKYFRKLIM